MAKKKRKFKKSFADLPEPIIQHILSFLPEKDATKTTIFCKSWLNAWRTKPNLEFNSDLFFGKESKIHHMGSEEEEKDEEEKDERRKKFSKYVKRTLKRYTQQKMSIETLKLDYLIYVDYSPVDSDSVLVQRCMRVAVERGVKKLHLSADCELPQIIVGAKSLVDLSIQWLNMLHLSAEKIMWHSLKRLSLYFVYFDEAMFENIISNCPLLEILQIDDVDDKFDDVDDQFDDIGDQLCNMLQFKVIEHHNLKQLTVSFFPSQRLILGEVPKLESLICTNLKDDSDWITGGLSLHSSQSEDVASVGS